jgi:hypothetical protein
VATALTLPEKRQAFRERFERLLAEQGVARIPSWFEPPWPEDASIASWLDRETRRCMRVDEAAAGDLELDFFFNETGLEPLRELVFRARDAHECAELVFRVYRRWFIEKISEDVLDAELEALLPSI